MNIGIGIDTGGTYTDAVVYDFSTQRVLAKGKALTTKENLSEGIARALDTLPVELQKKARSIALSTTLATNACVENKGGRAKLVLIGTTEKDLEWIGAETKYGLKNEEVLCIDTNGKADGNTPDKNYWIKELLDAANWLADADALSIVELNAIWNGSLREKKSKELLQNKFDMPVVEANEVAKELNVLERGTTALLNARLLPLIENFIKSVKDTLTVRGIDIPVMIVRSNGSLMSEDLSKSRPVETILSGPAASVLGGRALIDCEDCLIVDMGGTTTDISMVKGGVPTMVDKGIRIGGWRTQVKGVFIDTFALGGDSVIRINNGKLELGKRRVLPLCVAAEKWPEIKKELRTFLAINRPHSYPLHEVLYLVREPKDLSRYNPDEIVLCNALKNGPFLLANLENEAGVDVYGLKSERLESEGIIMRCGLTPTDIMHIKNDFLSYDRETSILAARYFLKCLPQYKDDEDSLNTFADEIYDMVKKKLYYNIIRILLTKRFPRIYENGLDDQMQFLISQSWKRQKNTGDKEFFDVNFATIGSLIGIGAPTHVFLPDIARALGTGCIIPEHAEVANAVGAAIADIAARAEVEISPNYTVSGIEGYTVYGPTGGQIYTTSAEASEAAKEIAVKAATEEARRRGALAELSVKTELLHNSALSKEGNSIDLGTSAVATVRNRGNEERVTKG